MVYLVRIIYIHETLIALFRFLETVWFTYKITKYLLEKKIHLDLGCFLVCLKFLFLIQISDKSVNVSKEEGLYIMKELDVIDGK